MPLKITAQSGIRLPEKQHILLHDRFMYGCRKCTLMCRDRKLRAVAWGRRVAGRDNEGAWGHVGLMRRSRPGWWRGFPCGTALLQRGRSAVCGVDLSEAAHIHGLYGPELLAAVRHYLHLYELRIW